MILKVRCLSPVPQLAEQSLHWLHSPTQSTAHAQPLQSHPTWKEIGSNIWKATSHETKQKRKVEASNGHVVSHLFCHSNNFHHLCRWDQHHKSFQPTKLKVKVLKVTKVKQTSMHMLATMPIQYSCLLLALPLFLLLAFSGLLLFTLSLSTHLLCLSRPLRRCFLPPPFILLLPPSCRFTLFGFALLFRLEPSIQFHSIQCTKSEVTTKHNRKQNTDTNYQEQEKAKK